jgi:hypothetical protein
MPAVTPVSTPPYVRQLSDDNPNGTTLGQNTSDLISFYNNTPVAQLGGNGQVAITRGLAAGVVSTYATTQSPSAVTTITTVASSMTVQNGTGGLMLPATTDVFYINKPTSQAGLGVGNVYGSSSNTLNVSFSNFTSGTITPTASQVYSVVGIRGFPSTTATLTPAAVAANTIAEQQFTVTGLPAGMLVQVNKPTNQAGLDIMGCRVVSSNVLGITYGNVTAASITPTAAEVYTVLALGGLDAYNNEIAYGFNVGTVGAIGGGVVITGGSTTLTGLLATDAVTGIFDPTAQANATNAAFPIKGIPTASVLTLYFAGIGSGATPTASEIYTIRTMRLNPAAPLLLYSQSLAPVSVAANTTAEQTFTVTGLVAGSPVWVNKITSATAGLGICGVRVSAANTLAINYGNVTASAIVPPTEVYLIGNFQVPTPGTGNSVYQTASPVMDRLSTLTNAERSALVTLGLIAGA